MEEPDKLVKQGFRLLSEGDYSQALSRFDKAIKVDPKNSEAYFGKAEAGMLVPKVGVEEVLALYKRAVELDPKNPYYLTSMGAFCIDIGRFNEAEAAYNKAAELDPENAQYYYSEFGVEYSKKAPEAMEQFLDDNTREIIARKALKYVLKSIGLDEEKAKRLLV